MLGVRISRPPKEGRAFAWGTYLMLVGLTPFTLALAISLGGEALVVMVATLLFVHGTTVISIEFIIRERGKPREIEFDSDGIRFARAGGSGFRLAWERMTKVRVLSEGPRRAPTSVSFVFVCGLRQGVVGIDLRRYRDTAEGFAGFVARYAPNARRSGRLDLLSWNPALATPGSVSMVAPEFEPWFYAVLGMGGPASSVYATSLAILFGIVSDRILGVAMVASYLALGVGQLAYARSLIRRFRATQSDAPPDRRGTVAFAAGVGLFLLEALLGIGIWFA